jgi:hypothetical protein
LQYSILLSGFVIRVLAVLVIPLSYIHNLLEMVFLLWFHFVCYCANCAVDNSCTQLSWFLLT